MPIAPRTAAQQQFGTTAEVHAERMASGDIGFPGELDEAASVRARNQSAVSRPRRLVAVPVGKRNGRGQ